MADQKTPRRSAFRYKGDTLGLVEFFDPGAELPRGFVWEDDFRSRPGDFPQLRDYLAGINLPPAKAHPESPIPAGAGAAGSPTQPGPCCGAGPESLPQRARPLPQARPMPADSRPWAKPHPFDASRRLVDEVATGVVDAAAAARLRADPMSVAREMIEGGSRAPLPIANAEVLGDPVPADRARAALGGFTLVRGEPEAGFIHHRGIALDGRCRPGRLHDDAAKARLDDDGAPTPEFLEHKRRVEEDRRRIEERRAKEAASAREAAGRADPVLHAAKDGPILKRVDDIGDAAIAWVEYRGEIRGTEVALATGKELRAGSLTALGRVFRLCFEGEGWLPGTEFLLGDGHDVPRTTGDRSGWPRRKEPLDFVIVGYDWNIEGSEGVVVITDGSGERRHIAVTEDHFRLLKQQDPEAHARLRKMVAERNAVERDMIRLEVPKLAETQRALANLLQVAFTGGPKCKEAVERFSQAVTDSRNLDVLLDVMRGLTQGDKDTLAALKERDASLRAAAVDHKRLADWIMVNIPSEIGRGNPLGESAADIAMRLLTPLASSSISYMSEIRGAIGRAWCDPANAEKVMDPDLAEAAAKEVKQLWDLRIGWRFDQKTNPGRGYAWDHCHYEWVRVEYSMDGQEAIHDALQAAIGGPFPKAWELRSVLDCHAEVLAAGIKALGIEPGDAAEIPEITHDTTLTDA